MIMQSSKIPNIPFYYPEPKPNMSVSSHPPVIEVNGYIEPTANNTAVKIVEQMASYLTYISIFSYCIKSDGTLSTIQDESIIQAARQNKVAPLMMITNFEGGIFNPELIHDILVDKKRQQTLVNHVLNILNKKKYDGVHIDFERIPSEDTRLYSEFLKNLKLHLSGKGFILSTLLAPNEYFDPTSYTVHRQLLKDYAILNETVDFTVLMNYEGGWAGGPPAAIAPFSQVKMVLDYALPIIPAQKIMLGVPLYGYDWSLPFTEKNQRAKCLSPQAAIELAQKHSTAIHLDYISRSPYFNYFDEDHTSHIVWFENEQSIKAKYDLVSRMSLRGVSFWSLGRPFPQNWRLLSKMFKIKKLE